MLKSLLAIMVASIAVGAAPQSRQVPHVVRIDDIATDVLYDFEGLQARKLALTKGCVKATASQNTQSLRMVCNEIDGTPKTPSKWVAHQCLPSGSGLGGGQVSFVVESFTGLHLPALDVEAQEAAFFEIHFEASNVTFDGFLSTTPQEKEAVKAQKKWLPANFRVSLGDMPTSRVSKTSPINIALGAADIDGDGRADFVIEDEIEITIPVEDAVVFESRWFRIDNDTGPTLKTLEIEYQDGDGQPVLTLSVPVSIEALGFADLFLGDIATPGREVQVSLRARGSVYVFAGGAP